MSRLTDAGHHAKGLLQGYEGRGGLMVNDEDTEQFINLMLTHYPAIQALWDAASDSIRDNDLYIGITRMEQTVEALRDLCGDE